MNRKVLLDTSSKDRIVTYWAVAFTLLASTILGCREDGAYSLPADVPAVPLLDSRVLATDEIRGAASTFAVEGDRIVLLDMFADSGIVVMDTAGQVLRRAGPRGDGPGETRTLTRVEIVEDTAWVWDSQLNRAYSLSLTQPDSEIRTWPMPAPASGSLTTIFVRNDRVVGTGIGQEGQYYEWSLAGSGLRVDESSGRWKGSQSRMLLELPEGKRWQASQSFAALSTNGDRLAVGYLDTGEFLIADVDNGETLVNVRLGDWRVEWESVERGQGSMFRTTEESLVGYVRVKAAGSRVIGLFVGKSRREAALEMSLDARHVHVFDWDGNLEAVYTLNRPVADVAVSEARLYGLVVEPVPKVVVWDLPRSIPDSDCFQGRTC